MKRALTVLAVAALTVCLAGCQQASETTAGCSSDQAAIDLSQEFTQRAAESVDALCSEYGEDSSSYSAASKPYAVFDFDNTTCINDISENLIVYQAQHMAYGFTAGSIRSAILSGVPQDEVAEGDGAYLASGKDSGKTYGAWADDIASDFAQLESDYSISPTGIKDKDELAQLHEDPAWQDFSAKICAFYYLIDANLGSSVSYVWVPYLLTGMTRQQAYDLSYQSCEYWSHQSAAAATLAGPADFSSKVGVATVSTDTGLAVTSSLKDLYATLHSSGIDVYVCSASGVEIVRAAVDCFGLATYVSGIIGITTCLEDGTFIAENDPTTGLYYVKGNGSWALSESPVGAQPFMEGKTRAIENVLAAEYGHGPIACFGDSTGDFNMCTEFSDTKLVIVFNALRGASNGGTALVMAALKQEAEGTDLDAANQAGDTLYVVNGRDENTMTLRTDTLTVDLGATDARQFKDDETAAAYDEFASSGQTVAEFFAARAADVAENWQGYKVK